MTLIRKGRSGLVASLLAAAVVVGCSGSGGGGEKPTSLEQRIAAGVDEQFAYSRAFDEVRAVVVRQDGRTVFERHDQGASDDHYAVQSVTKSVMSTLIGVAVGDGLLSVDSTLAELLPERAAQMRPWVGDVTLEQVLTHTGGFEGDDDPEALAFAQARDPVAEILAGAEPPDPDRPFAYSSAGTQLLSAILVEATGEPVLDYARARLFDPLGIDTDPGAQPLLVEENIAEYEAADFAWPVDRLGLHQGWAYLKLTPDDLAKLGQLYLDDGMWDGAEVVPADWVEAATSRKVADTDNPDWEGHGYLWWLADLDGHAAYAAIGYGGQMVVVVDDLDLVVVVATELRLDDPTSRGVGQGVLTALIESAVVGPASEAGTDD